MTVAVGAGADLPVGPPVLLAVLAAVAAAGAAALLVRPDPTRNLRRRTGTDAGNGRREDTGSRRGSRWLALGLLGGAVLAAGGIALVRLLAPVLVALAAAWVLLVLHRRRRADRLATERAERVRETCETLASELAAGRPPGAALERAAEEWAVLAPVAEAHRVGADVPAAWRAAGEVPGAGDLRLVAAAWQVAHRTGHGLAHAVARVSVDLRRARGTRRVVAGELASARATARLVAVLPVGALLMGSGAGGDPVAFLLGHPVGLACLAAGVALALAGLAWIEALAREAGRGA